jgi:hypothetical protein
MRRTRSTIFGRVLDPQNAAVVAAEIVVTNTDTNAITRLRSNMTDTTRPTCLTGN